MSSKFPVLVREIQTDDIYSFQSLGDFKIFIWENRDILNEFEAWTSDGYAINLVEDIMKANDLDMFIGQKMK